MSQADTSRTGRIRWALKSTRDLFYLPRLAADKESLDRIQDIDELVERLCTRKRRRGIIRANQNPLEIKRLYDLIAASRPKVVVEIGTSKGGTLYLWSRAAAPGALLVSIDLPGGCGTVTQGHQAVFQRFGQERGVDTRTLAFDSHSLACHRELQRILDGRKIEFLFIDGDHSYEGIKADFTDYSSYLHTDGLVALHDIAIPETHPTITVKKFWNELQRERYHTQAILASPGKSPGIGLVSQAGRETQVPARCA